MPYTEKFEDALVYAARLHRDQTRKGTGVPYVTHLLAVAAIVGESGGTEDEVIAALLHDAPEDAGGEARLAEIRDRYGDEVADIVAGCTDTYEDPKPPWRRAQGGLPRPPRRGRGPPSASSPRRTSSTTPAPFSPTTGSSGRTSGAASTAAGTARSGTTGRSRTCWRGTVPVADELGRVVAELGARPDDQGGVTGRVASARASGSPASPDEDDGWSRAGERGSAGGG